MSPVPGRGFWYVPVLWVMLGCAAVAAAPGCHGAGLGLSPPRLLLCVALRVVPCPLTVLWDPPRTGWLAGWQAAWSGDHFCHVWWHWEGRNPDLSWLWGPGGNMGGSPAAQVSPSL